MAIARAMRAPVRTARGMSRRYQRMGCGSLSTWLGNGRWVGGKADLHEGAALRGPAEPGLATPASRAPRHDREPETGARGAAAAVRPPVEALEDAVALIRGDAGPGVRDADEGRAAPVLGGHGDEGSRSGVLDR